MPQHQYGLGGLTVLHLAQPVDGGVARVVTGLVRAQTAAGARVVLACPPGGPLADEARAAGAHTVPWPARRSPGPDLAREVAAAARVVRGAAPGLVHLHSAKAGLAGRLAVRGRVPTVFQPHAWSYEAVGGPVRAAAVGWERWAARWADRVLCVSEAERESGERHGVRARWAVAPNGVDTGHFTPAVGREAARAALSAFAGPTGLTGPAGPAGLDPRAPLVVCVGRLCPQKGQDVLLRAWPAVAARVPGARLVLVGDGPDAESLRAAAPGSVLLAGASADPLPWYQAADVVVQPSRWEGMALAPLEAMACGRPVVLSDVAGARECLPDADRAACLVPPADEAALASALVRLLGDPALAAAAGLRGLAHVRARHDARRTTEAVAAVYAEVLSARGARSGGGPRTAESVGTDRTAAQTGTARPVGTDAASTARAGAPESTGSPGTALGAQRAPRPERAANAEPAGGSLSAEPDEPAGNAEPPGPALSAQRTRSTEPAGGSLSAATNEPARSIRTTEPHEPAADDEPTPTALSAQTTRNAATNEPAADVERAEPAEPVRPSAQPAEPTPTALSAQTTRNAAPSEPTVDIEPAPPTGPAHRAEPVEGAGVGPRAASEGGGR